MFNRMIRAGVLLAAVPLAACMHTKWAPPPGGSEFTNEQAMAQCRLMAKSGSRGFGVAGNYQFVAAASLGYAIGVAAEQAQNFEDCMLARGYLKLPNT